MKIYCASRNSHLYVFQCNHSNKRWSKWNKNKHFAISNIKMVVFTCVHLENKIYHWRCDCRAVAMSSFIQSYTLMLGLELMIYFNCICKLDSIKQVQHTAFTIFSNGIECLLVVLVKVAQMMNTSFGASTLVQWQQQQQQKRNCQWQQHHFNWVSRIDNFKCTQHRNGNCYVICCKCISIE